MAQRLQTPESIRRLQRKLYLKAKAEPDCRFHQLHDKVWRDDILLHAWELALFNGGASGVDGVTFDQIDAEGLEGWLTALQKGLREKTYRPTPVRHVSTPKPGSGKRPLGILLFGTAWSKPQPNFMLSGKPGLVHGLSSSFSG